MNPFHRNCFSHIFDEKKYYHEIYFFSLAKLR